MQIQSILFDRNLWNKKNADKWIIEHKFIKIFKGKKGIHNTEKYLRYRQEIPDYKNYKYRIMNIGGGIKFIIGV